MWLMTPTKTRPHKPMLAEWTSEILSLSLKNVMKLIANSLSVAKVAPTEMAGEAGPNKPALLNRQRM